MTPTTRLSGSTPTRKPAAVTTTTKRRATTTTVGRVTTTTKRFSNSTTTVPFRNRTSTTTGRTSANNAPPPKNAAKVTTTTKPKKSKSEKAGKTPRKLKDDVPSSTPLAPWLPGYRPLDPPKLGSDGPLPERPEGPPPSGAAVADQEGGGPDLPSMVVVAMVPLGALLMGGAFVAFTRWRKGSISLS